MNNPYGQQQPAYNPYQQTGYQYPQQQQSPGGAYGGNWDPNTNSQPAGYAHGVRIY